MSVTSEPAPSQTLSTSLFQHKPLRDKKFTATFIHEKELYSSTATLDAFMKTASSPSARFGLAGAYVPCNEETLRDNTACLLTKVAVATPEAVLVITLHFPDDTNPCDIVDHTVLYDILFNPVNPLAYVGFNVDRLALQLFGEYGLAIRNAIDIFSITSKSFNAARNGTAFMNAYKKHLDMSLATDMLKNENDKPENDTILATRAWVGAVLDQASERLAMALDATAPIDTSVLSEKELIELKKTLLSSDRLRGTAAELQKHEVEINRTENKISLVSQQFNTRVRKTSHDVELTFENEIVLAQIKKIVGKRAELKPIHNFDWKAAGKLLTAVTLGKEEETHLDHQRSNFILHALQGKIKILDNPLLRQIWFPEDVPVNQPLPDPALKGVECSRLNNSQLEAVEDMLRDSADPRIVLVHGPPGTGKTSVIAAMVQCLLCANDEETSPDNAPKRPSLYDVEEEELLPDPPAGPTVWIMAQSNVAVKNVAEKLVKVGIEQFKLIVSKEFYADWHEDIYGKIREKTFTTSSLPKEATAVRTFLGDTSVILCTLSMATSSLLCNLNFHEYMPFNNIVIDEASQIQLGDLLPLLHLHGPNIKRLCMVGDHRQLAPYGQEEVQEIESIFENGHIVEKAVFLKITYRLPKPIGVIISDEVYRSQLIPFSKESRSTCCKWFDIPGKEEQDQDGTSYYNPFEIDACILMAKELEEKKKEYRIISPYATQSSKISERLKLEGMDWEDKCFNVDSFQGNEADYIIISLVRTEKLGFLYNNRRANVLLTRCKKGMFVMTSKDLMLRERSRETLLGKFAFRWDASQGNRPWPTLQDLQEGRQMVDEELPDSTPTPSILSKAAARKARHAGHDTATSSGEKPTQQPKVKGKGRRRNKQRPA